jgi:hypothetical protein
MRNDERESIFWSCVLLEEAAEKEKQSRINQDGASITIFHGYYY